MHPDLRKIGEEALASHDQNQLKAKEWMVQQFLNRQDLFEQYVLPIIETTVDSILSYICGQERRAIRTDREVVGPHQSRSQPHNGEVPPSPRLIKGQALLAQRNWLQYPIGNKVLGELTKDELLKSASWYLNAGRTNTVTGNFLLEVAEHLPDFTTQVKMVWDGKTLAALHDSVNAAAA